MYVRLYTTSSPQVSSFCRQQIIDTSDPQGGKVTILDMFRKADYEKAKRLLRDETFLREIDKLKTLMKKDSADWFGRADQFREGAAQEEQTLADTIRKMQKKAQQVGLVFEGEFVLRSRLDVAVSELIKEYALPASFDTEQWIKSLVKQKSPPNRSAHSPSFSYRRKDPTAQEFVLNVSDFDSEANLHKLLKFLKENGDWKPSKKGHPEKWVADWRLVPIFEKCHDSSLPEDQVLNCVEKEIEALANSGKIRKTYKRSTIRRKYRDWKPQKRTYNYWPSS
jgi:hypothetical protein